MGFLRAEVMDSCKAVRISINKNYNLIKDKDEKERIIQWSVQPALPLV